jgi:hypothetical protein
MVAPGSTSSSKDGKLGSSRAMNSTRAFASLNRSNSARGVSHAECKEVGRSSSSKQIIKSETISFMLPYESQPPQQVLRCFRPQSAPMTRSTSTVSSLLWEKKQTSTEPKRPEMESSYPERGHGVLDRLREKGTDEIVRRRTRRTREQEWADIRKDLNAGSFEFVLCLYVYVCMVVRMFVHKNGQTCKWTLMQAALGLYCSFVCMYACLCVRLCVRRQTYKNTSVHGILS